MTTRRIAGVAGLVYAAAAAIENMGLLEAPTLTSPVADVRALYEDQALAVVTSLAGAVELLAYCVFAVPLFGLLREREPRGEGWSFLALAGGVARQVVAAAGLVATAVLVADVGAGLGDDAVATLFDLSLTARMLSGGFLALFMAGVGLSALRSRALPSWLALYACAAALPPAIAPVAAFAAEHAVQVAAWIAFSLQARWIFLAGFWLTLADGRGLVAFVRRCAFLLLVLGAGLVGIAGTTPRPRTPRSRRNAREPPTYRSARGPRSAAGGRRLGGHRGAEGVGPGAWGCLPRRRRRFP
jgi:hypothetical protein